MTDKYGPYIQKLMTVVIDSEQDEFVQMLAWSELNRLKAAMDEILNKNNPIDDSQEQEETKKILLQEKQNAKD
jgi:hypothetical protein|tara:strand:- start:1992 stop:2210 length:219 start_codon:yes stop_codon:yes gene_type:complete